MKKLYLILGLLLVVIIAALVYLFFFRTTGTPATSGGVTTNGSLPNVNGGGAGPTGANGAGSVSSSTSAGESSTFGVVSNEPVLSYFVNASNTAFLVEPDGTVTSVSAGATSSLSGTPLQNVISAGFSYNGAKAFVNFGDPAAPQTSIFDVSSTVWAPQKTGMIAPVWSPSDLRIAYLTANADGTVTLSTLDLSRPSAKPLALITLHAQDLTLAWPNKNEIVLEGKSSAYEKSAPLIFTVSTRTIFQPLAPTAGLEIAWSNTATMTALTFESGAAARGGDLALWTPSTANVQNLTIQTLPSKCLFSQQGTSSLALFCAIPRDANAFSNAALPDAYEQKSLFTSDTIDQIDVGTGAITPLLAPAQAVDATDLRIFGSTLFFINRYDNRLYALSLAS